MYYIGIEKLTLTHYVGIYPEESRIPNTLEFNVKIGHQASNPSEIPNWDYSVIAKLISEIMYSEKQHFLLEDILNKILIKMKQHFEYHNISIQIKKLNPPTNEPIQSSYIEWTENI